MFMLKRHHLVNLLLLVGVWLGVALARRALAERQLVGSGGRRLEHGRLVEVEADQLVVTWRDGQGQTRLAAAASATIPDVGHRLAVGQRVFVATGEADGSPVEVVGLVREGHLLCLLGLFLSLFVLVGGPQAWASVVGLVAALAGTFLLLVPLLVAGCQPLLAAAVSAAALVLVLALTISGFQRRTLAIVLGGLAGLVATGLLAWLVTGWLRLSGVHSTFTQDLWHATRTTAGFDFRALLRAGILFGALGVIVDLATGVSASVFEVADVDRRQSPAALALAGLRVGRDVMSTEINTLVFAHVGAQVGLLLLPFYGPPGYELPAMQILSLSDFAAEAAHVAVGTAGMILTIPCTALAAGFLAGAGRARQAGSGVSLRPARRGRAWLLAVVAWTVAAVVAGQLYVGSWHRYRRGASGATVAELVRAVAVDATAAAAAGGRPPAERSQTVRVRLLTGSAAGREMTIHNPISGYPGHDRPAEPGGLFLVKTMVSGGESFGAILDYDRGPALLWLVWGLGLLVLLVGGWLGVKALAALLLCVPLLGLGMYLVVAVRLPALPVVAAASLCICLLAFWLLAGCSRKALVAAGGAFGGIAVGGLAAAFAGSAMAFSGLQSPSLFAIRMFGGLQGELDFAGLLAAGILLGIVGVAMDVSIAVASAAEEIAAAGAASRGELWRRGMNVGRKILCTMVMALMFAYLGANLPLLLLPSFVADVSARQAINSELFAAEILRLLAGGIGIVVAIPASALLAIFFQHRLSQGTKGVADVQST